MTAVTHSHLVIRRRRWRAFQDDDMRCTGLTEGARATMTDDGTCNGERGMTGMALIDRGRGGGARR
jgi:hypothetical protein